MQPLSPPVRPVAALTVALAVAFGGLAVLVAHTLELHAFSPVEFYALIALGCLASVPTTSLAAQAPSQPHGRGPSRLRPLLVTLASGGIVGALAQGFTIATMAPGETLWLNGLSLGSDRAAWVVLGALAGAVVSMVGFVLLDVGLASVRRSPFVHDAEESLGIPGVCIATLAGACALFVLRVDELAGGVAVVALGLGFLVVMLLRDARRVAYVRRVFAGAEPNVEVRAEPSDEELRSLFRLADIAPGVVVADKQSGAAYRSTARGRGRMLLAATAEETLAPVRRRMRYASYCVSATAVACIARAVILGALAG